MRSVLILLILPALFLASCGESETNNDREKLLSDINKLEAQLYDSTKMNDGVAMEMIMYYERFANAYKEDTLAPEYLFRAAEICQPLKQADKALKIYEKIEKEFPEYKKRGVCIFMQGFVCETMKMDYEKARFHYERFLKEYPNHALAPNTREMLKVLGLTPEELIQRFEENSTKTDTIV
jgi:tetratricopeptide (TPR) repeat protein